MTPAPPPPPKDDDADVRDVLNEPAADGEGFDPDTVDADFEQELEDLFADDLEDAPAVDESGGPIVLDDQVEPVAGAGDDQEELLVLDEVVEEPAGAGPAPEDGDEDLLVLDDPAGEPAGEDELIVLDEVVELVEEADAGDDARPAPEAAESPAEIEALVDDIAEEDLAAAGEDEEIIDLNDLVEEPAETPAPAEDEPLLDLDALIEEEAASEPEEEISPEPEEPAGDAGDDALAAAMAEQAAPEVPVDEAVAAEDIEAIMDEPEPEPESAEPEPAEPAEPAPAEAPVDAELTGLDQLEDDDMEDVDSLLDNVEVDVSGVMDAEESDADLEDDMVMDLDEGSLDEVLAAESMPPDAGMDVDADVDMLLAETREEAEPTLEDLQATVRQLEGRVEELERRLREEIAQLVPAEAAKIIREEIAALAAELDD